MEHVFEMTEEKGLLSLKGKLTIENAAEFKCVLEESLNGVSALILDIGGVTCADVSGLQLICAAHRVAVLSGKEFTLTNVGNDFHEAADKAGLLRHIGCSHGPGDACLWLDCKYH